MVMIRVRIWRISRQGRTLWVSGVFSSEEKALEWATRKVVKLIQKGYLASIQVG